MWISSGVTCCLITAIMMKRQVGRCVSNATGMARRAWLMIVSVAAAAARVTLPLPLPLPSGWTMQTEDWSALVFKRTSTTSAAMYCAEGRWRPCSVVDQLPQTRHLLRCWSEHADARSADCGRVLRGSAQIAQHTSVSTGVGVPDAGCRACVEPAWLRQRNPRLESRLNCVGTCSRYWTLQLVR